MKHPLILGCSAALIIFATPVRAKSPGEIEQIARSVSIEIQVAGKNRVGSGIIVHRQGNLYTLVTNRHVACGSPLCRLPAQQNYILGTADGQRYQLPVSGVMLARSNLDLAFFQFRSSRSYPVAQVAAPGSLNVDDVLFTAGFPKGQGFLFGEGRAQAVVHKRLTEDKGGYTVIYDAETLPGMSGGGAFDRDGRLVAIHGYGDRFQENTQIRQVNVARAKLDSKIGFNRGIPVRWVVQSLGNLGIAIGDRPSSSPTQVAEPTVSVTADEFFIAGFNKFVEPGEDVVAGKRQAIDFFSRAISINARYGIAYFLRAYVHKQLQEYPQALADYN